MNEKLPVVSGKDVIKALSRAGFRFLRQKGSHVRLEKVEGEKMIKLTVPMHETLKKRNFEADLDRCRNVC